MSESFKVGQLYPMPISPSTFTKSKQQTTSTNGELMSFSSSLEKELLKFSHHAELRMAQRGISLPQESIREINNAIDSAEKKGAKDSLIVYRDIAMIVNVPTRTVVTALDGGQLESNVFTQIDSAVILR